MKVNCHACSFFLPPISPFSSCNSFTSALKTCKVHQRPPLSRSFVILNVFYITSCLCIRKKWCHGLILLCNWPLPSSFLLLKSRNTAAIPMHLSCTLAQLIVNITKHLFFCVSLSRVGTWSLWFHIPPYTSVELCTTYGAILGKSV